MADKDLSLEIPDLRVLHSCLEWAPLTQGWLRNQVLWQRQLGVLIHVAAKRGFGGDHLGAAELSTLDQDIWLTKNIERLRVGLFESTGFRYVAKAAKAFQPNVIHSHFANVAWTDLHSLREHNAKHVMSVYGYDIDQLPDSSSRWARRYERLASDIDLIFCEGPHVKTRLEARGFASEKLFVNYLAVDIEGLPFSFTPLRPGEPLKVLMAASFREKKGIPNGLMALAKLAKERPIEVTLIGDSASDSKGLAERGRIDSALADPALAGRVRRLGYRSHQELIAESADHHLFLQPSLTAVDGDTEGGAPVSLIEMQALGVPVLATSHCDIPNVIANPYRDFLAGEGDVDQLYRRLDAFVASSDSWGEFAMQARKFVRERFSPIPQTQKQIDAYLALLN